MKKFNYLCGAAFACAAMFMVSCSVHDDPVPNNDEPQYEVLFTYDFAAAAAAEENPVNKNGSASNGQAFWAWEKADKTDSKRQDYKGYEWAEGSVLPEECHVWRRSDRINNNVKDGGLACPNNREMVVDGLEVGYVVEIIYDNEAAADDAKSIIWAAAVNAETGPRYTATINGAEAVSGETAIASGDKIEVTAIEPAENGTTGYLAFQIKKGMVIKSIVISKKL
jgi:hypothetical protein